MFEALVPNGECHVLYEQFSSENHADPRCRSTEAETGFCRLLLIYFCCATTRIARLHSQST